MVEIVLILSVVLGAGLGYLLGDLSKIQRLLLTFSGAFLLTFTLLEIFPHIYHTDFKGMGLYVVAGVFIQIFLETVTRGAEHGHIHHKTRSIPIPIFAGLFVHAFLEGVPLRVDHDNHLLTAIFVHNIPVALILYTFLTKIGLQTSWVMGLIGIFAMASPMGYWFGQFLPESMAYPALGITAGIFLHISTVILFESADNHKLKMQKVFMIISGFLVAYLSLMGHNH
ncbi:MAG: ZIP family metal transporter [Weeksellaceae bacterium]|nr:ZIP family metal transporter [Weeksellaceae bacterium]